MALTEYFLLYAVTDRNVASSWYPCHMYHVEIWKPSSLPLDRKYQGAVKGKLYYKMYEVHAK